MRFPYLVTFVRLTETGSDSRKFRVLAPTAIAAANRAMSDLTAGFETVFEMGWECTDVEFLKEPGGTSEQETG